MGASGREALYIVKKNLKNNTITVVPKSKAQKFYQKKVQIKAVNWISGRKPASRENYLARIRYRQPLQKCRVHATKNKTEVIFDKPQKAVTPGQSLVLYKNKELLGGGVIL
jgi:tRNA-specific 2-thiouridylase